MSVISTALVWIVLPGMIGAALLLVQQRTRLVFATGIILALLLAGAAWQAPIGERIRLGSWFFTLEDTFIVLGRRFVLGADDRYALILIYQGLAFWFGGAALAGVTSLFVPLGLTIVALLTAALSVEPVLFAAPLLELAALASVPLLADAGRGSGARGGADGVLRFITFMTIGFPFILLAGWLVGGTEATSQLFLSLGVILGLGFAFLFGIFPFHTWMTMLSEESNPYSAAFIFYILPLVVSLLGLSFLDRYGWLRSPEVFTALSLVGALMVAIGGLGSALQRHFGRILGHAAIMETGFSLLAVSLLGQGSQPGLSLFFALILPRGLSLGIWALALSLLGRSLNADQPDPSYRQVFEFRSMQGVARRFPWAASAMLLAHFSLAGFPLLAGFPVRLALLDALSEQQLGVGLVALLGLVGLTASGMRSLAVLIMGDSQQGWLSQESTAQKWLLGLGGVMLFIVGLFPQWLTPFFVRMSVLFPDLAR